MESIYNYYPEPVNEVPYETYPPVLDNYQADPELPEPPGTPVKSTACVIL